MLIGRDEGGCVSHSIEARNFLFFHSCTLQQQPKDLRFDSYIVYVPAATKSYLQVLGLR